MSKLARTVPQTKKNHFEISKNMLFQESNSKQNQPEQSDWQDPTEKEHSTE